MVWNALISSRESPEQFLLVTLSADCGKLPATSMWSVGVTMFLFFQGMRKSRTRALGRKLSVIVSFPSLVSTELPRSMALLLQFNVANEIALHSSSCPCTCQRLLPCKRYALQASEGWRKRKLKFQLPPFVISVFA